MFLSVHWKSPAREFHNTEGKTASATEYQAKLLFRDEEADTLPYKEKLKEILPTKRQPLQEQEEKMGRCKTHQEKQLHRLLQECSNTVYVVSKPLRFLV